MLRPRGGRAGALPGGSLDHGGGARLDAQSQRRDGLVERDRATLAVEPDEVEREAHAERMDRAAAWQEKGTVGPSAAAEGESEQARAEGTSDDDLHAALSAEGSQLAPLAAALSAEGRGLGLVAGQLTAAGWAAPSAGARSASIFMNSRIHEG